MINLKPFDDFFRGASNWRLKLFGVFGFGLLIGLKISIKVWLEDGNGWVAVLGPPLFGVGLMLLVVPFLIADSVALRMNEGQQVALLTRIFFGPGAASRTLRIVLISAIVVAVIGFALWPRGVVHRT